MPYVQIEKLIPKATFWVTVHFLYSEGGFLTYLHILKILPTYEITLQISFGILLSMYIYAVVFSLWKLAPLRRLLEIVLKPEAAVALHCHHSYFSNTGGRRIGNQSCSVWIPESDGASTIATASTCTQGMNAGMLVTDICTLANFFFFK